ncbi:unnamed protein product [Cuscuta europaea]|uniref:Uncharacterized protein n=1 Tax=Cuscuta europaea TaxID=41803 RepID=A0A9P0ZKF6_CUSEU|nr:unnamed protein product [Cuscuta europaea]
MNTANQESPVCLKLLIDEKVNRVVAAEANSDFADILLSFLTIPMGTIIRLTSKTDAQKAASLKIGCMNKLYHAFENLNPEIWYTKHCRTMVLNPRNPRADYCKKLKISVDDSGSQVTYMCSRGSCGSKYEDVPCKCGDTTKAPKERKLTDDSLGGHGYNGGAFLKRGRVMFIISDNLQINPSSPTVLAQILSGLGSSEMNQISEMSVDVSKEQVTRLLARSLVSKSPLTDVFLPKMGASILPSLPLNQPRLASLLMRGPNGLLRHESKTVPKLYLKVTLNKSSNKILFAEATNEFFDFLCTFMTIPIGAIVYNLKWNSGLGCMDALYTSMVDLDDKWFESGATNSLSLSFPALAQHHDCKNQPLKLSEFGSKIMMNPKGGTNFAQEPSEFIISDDLEVKPLSSASCFNILKAAPVPTNERPR